MISVFILPSNTIFLKTERELSESEIEEEESGKEHTPPANQAPAREIAPRERSNPEPRALRLRLRIAPFDFIFAPFDFNFAGEPGAQITHLTSPRSHRDGTDRTDHTKIAIEKWLGFDEFDRI